MLNLLIFLLFLSKNFKVYNAKINSFPLLCEKKVGKLKNQIKE